MSSGALYGSWSNANGTVMDYWPGAHGHAHSCACGVTGACKDPAMTCNCDTMDGQPSHDFGVILDKAHLPVGSLHLKDIGTGKQANYSIGALQCAPEQFGKFHQRKLTFLEYNIAPKNIIKLQCFPAELCRHRPTFGSWCIWEPTNN